MESDEKKLQQTDREPATADSRQTANAKTTEHDKADPDEADAEIWQPDQASSDLPGDDQGEPA